MSDQSKLGLGQIITTPQQRDAIHIAVAPVTAGEKLTPGDHVRLAQDGTAARGGGATSTIGVVDPFLKGEVRPGNRFWLYLYPGSITSLRHEWTHPAFSDEKSVSLAWLAEFASRTGFSTEKLIDLVDTGGGCVGDNNAQDYFEGQKTILCAHVAAATGKAQDPENVWFSCAC